MELGKSFYIDLITSDPVTGEPVNADSNPIVYIFEDDNDTPILTIDSEQRGAIVGHYRVFIDATEANGFESDKSYAVIASASLTAVNYKSVITNFIIDAMTPLQVASQMQPLAIPAEFTPTMVIIAPEPVASLEEMFGYSSGYEHKDLFSGYYNQETNTWTDGTSGIVPVEIKEEVAMQKIAYDEYLTALLAYNSEYNTQRELQWRLQCANDLIALS